MINMRNRLTILVAAIMFAVLLCLPGTASAWPTTDQWIGIYKSSAPLQDPVTDAGGERNIVDSSGNFATYTYYDGTYFFTRLRLDANPVGQGGQGLLSQFGWGMEFDTNQNADDYEWLTLVDGKGSPDINNGNETILLEQNTVQQSIGDPSDKCEVVNSWLDLAGNFQINLADTVTNGDADYFLDFRFPYATLKTALGIDDYQPIRILFGSSSSTNALVETGADLCGGTNLTLYTGLSDYLVPLGGTRPTDGSVMYTADIYGNGDVTERNAGSTLYIKVTDADRNINLTGLDTVTVTVTVPGGDSETITLTETGNNTGIYTAQLPTASSVTHTSGDGTLQVVDGEYATATYTDAIAADLSRDVARTDTCLMHAPAVSVTKAVTPGRVVAGEVVTYTIRLHNDGGSAAPVSTVTDVLPAGFSYVEFSTNGGMTTVEPSISGQTLTWSGAWSIPAEGHQELTFQAAASTTDGNYMNNASFSGAGYPSPATGDTASVEVVHLSIAKAANVSRVITGGTVTYTLTISSTATTDIPFTQITDTLPSGFAYVTGTTGGTLGVTANPAVSGQTLTWDGSWNVPAGGSVTLTFNATASSAAGTYTNVATFSPTGFTTRTTGNAAPVEVVALTMTKTVNPTETVKGGTVTYTMVMTNSSASAVSVTSVSDTLAAGFAYVTGTSSGMTASDPAGTTGTITWSTGGPWSIPAASGGTPGSLTLSFNATAPNSVGGPHYNTASFNSTGFPTVSTGATAPVYVQLYTIAKSVTPSPVVVGGTVTYTITFTNSTNTNETITQITDTLPAGFTYVTGTTGGTLGVTANPTGTSGTITWNGSWTLTKSASLTLTFNATAASSAGTYYNDAGWTVSGKTVQPTGNTAPVTVYDLNIAKTVDKTDVLPGDTVRYTITLTNTSGPAIPVTQVTDTLPAGFTYVTGTTTGLTTNNPAGTTGTITWDGAWTLPANGTLTLSFDATASSVDGTYTNSASFTPTGYPVRTVTGTAPVKVRHLTITKSVTPSSVVAGGTVTYTMTLSNTGTTAVPVTRVTDTLPAGFSYDAGTATGLTTADPSISGQVLTWNGAWSIPAGGTLTLSFDSTASSVDGTYDNSCSFTPTGYPVRTSGFTAPVTVIHLSIAKSATPSSVLAGGTVAYTITLSTTSGSAVPVTQVTDTLPAGFIYQAGTTSGLTTSDPGIAGQTLTWNGAWSIPAGGSTTLTFNATASTTDGTYDNSATYTPTGYPVQSISNTAPVTVIHMSIAKSASPTTVLAGGIISYTITLSTTSGSAVPVTQVTDTLPAGFGYRTGTTSGLTTADPGIAGQTLTWNGAWSIPAGGSTTLSFQVDAGTTDGTYDNSAAYTPTGYAAQSTGSTAPVTVIHISITKTANPATVVAGRNLTYTITMTTTSGTDLTVSQVADTLPAGFSYRAGTSSGLTTADPVIAGQVLTWGGAWTLPAGGSLTLGFGATASSTPGTYDNVASFIPSGFGSLSTGNTATVTVQGQPHIELAKTVDKAHARPGEVLTYTVHYHNTGGSAAYNLVLIDTVPPNTTYVTGSMRSGSASSTYATATPMTDGAGDDAGEFDGGSVIFRFSPVSADDGTAGSGVDEGNIFLQLLIDS